MLYFVQFELNAIIVESQRRLEERKKILVSGQCTLLHDSCFIDCQ